MGFIDDVQSKLNRGVAGANRSVEAMKLKGQLSDAMKRRQQLAAQLGASLYETMKDVPEFREGREQLFDGIAQIDAERVSIQAQLDEIERQTAESTQAATLVDCPFCHSRISASDLFCSGCGKSMEEIRAASSAASSLGSNGGSPSGGGSPAASAGLTCPGCGAPVGAEDSFCMHCGKSMEEVRAASSAASPLGSNEGSPSGGGSPAASAGLTCPGCGAPIEAEDSFCMHCGNKLNA